MEIAKLVLEYVKVLLSAPVMAAVVATLFFLLFREDVKALLLRVGKIRLPGGAEVSTTQSERQEKEAAIEQKPIPQPEAALPGLPSDLLPNQRAAIEEIIRAQRATAYLWEYRYLNYFLVYHTQHVLDWLSNLKQQITYGLYDAHWLPFIPSANERSTIITVLEAHHLIQVVNGVIQVTPKGQEYREWRGTLPELPKTIN